MPSSGFFVKMVFKKTIKVQEKQTSGNNLSVTVSSIAAHGEKIFTKIIRDPKTRAFHLSYGGNRIFLSLFIKKWEPFEVNLLFFVNIVATMSKRFSDFSQRFRDYLLFEAEIIKIKLFPVTMQCLTMVNHDSEEGDTYKSPLKR